MAVNLDSLLAEVTAQTTVVQSAVTLLNSIPGLIAAAGNDPQKLADLAAAIQANTDSLAAAVVANTTSV